MIGLPEMIALVEGDDLPSDRLLHLQVVENEVRANLTAVDAGRAYQTLMTMWSCSQKELAARLGIDRSEAARYIELYFSRFPGIRNYMAETIAFAKDQGFVTTLFGRKCHAPLILSKNQGERQFAERAVVNARVQGTAADIIKRAMVQMPGALAKAGLPGTKMLLQVHDELVFEVPEAEVDPAKSVIRAVMANAHRPLVDLSVPLGVDIGHGASWGDAH
jgi:DNA polymerase-1